MSKVILHIGTHKTATTTIQNAFHANRDLLAAHGVDYPALGHTTGHHGLAMRWLPLPEVFSLPEGPQEAWTRLTAAPVPGRTLFLSSEEFSRGMPEPSVDLGELRGLLSRFDRVEVVCTLRDQRSYLQSIYLEVSKKQAPPPWPNFLAASLASGFGAGLFLDFAALDDHLRTAFAPDEITYIDYAGTARAPGGLPGRFLDLLGLPLTPADLAPGADGQLSNPSPDPLAAWIASQIAAPWPAPRSLVDEARSALRAEFGEGRPTTIYTRAEEMRLLARFASANARFSEAIAARQPGFALTAPPPQPTIYREDVGPGPWIRMGRKLHGALKAAETAQDRQEAVA